MRRDLAELRPLNVRIESGWILIGRFQICNESSRPSSGQEKRTQSGLKATSAHRHWVMCLRFPIVCWTYDTHLRALENFNSPTF